MGKLVDFINKKRNSLKFTLIFYYMLIFFVFVCLFVGYTHFALKDYYYNNLKSTMLSQSTYASELYQSYISAYSLNDVVLNERFEFMNNLNGQVQLLDNNYVIIYDNTGSSEAGQQIQNSDDNFGLDNDYRFDINSEDNIMSLTYVIKNNNTQIGFLRTTTSLEQINNEVYRRSSIFALVGIASLILGFYLLYYFGGRFLKPINKLTDLAGKLSDGQYKEKSNMEYSGEIGELAKTMDQLSENIVAKEEIKNEFISSVSHELRTPLTSIKGWALTLQDSSLDDETRAEGLMIIEHEADRLSDMVEDLLDFSRFTSPSFSLNKTDFNLVAIVKNIVRQMKPRSVDKEINLLFDYNKEVIMVMGDENRLKQVFINLIDNAIKFTDGGGSVVVSLLYKENNRVLCQVIDSGIGISEQEIELVTTKFYKGTSKGSHTGLGLSISEEIILKHNSKLEISSIEGEGTTISFILETLGEQDEEI